MWAWALSSAVSVGGAWMPAFRIAGGVTLAALLVAVTLSSMTIVVKQGEIAWWLGIGWPRSHLPLDRLADASATRGGLLYGWGTHLAFGGWPWGVRSLNAVRLRTQRRRSIVLGTDRPQELLDAIARARWAGAA